MKTRQPVTEEDVQRALRRFLERGGAIRRLSPTRALDLPVIGARHGQFEHPRELLGLSGAYYV